MDLKDVGCRARFLIRDRDGTFPAGFDTILQDAGIEVVLSGVRMPRMNSIMERWVQTCRRELLDRTLIWNRPHLVHALGEFEQFYNRHRPMRLTPVQAVAPDRLARLDIRQRDRLGGVLHEYEHAALTARMAFSAGAPLPTDR
jgi:putative transposase